MDNPVPLAIDRAEDNPKKVQNTEELSVIQPALKASECIHQSNQDNVDGQVISGATANDDAQMELEGVEEEEWSPFLRARANAVQRASAYQL